jgi:hypothetical protein
LREGGASVGQTRQAVDRLSAILILESYLGFRQNENHSALGEIIG